MNENEEKAFRAAYLLYAKWRETIFETDEQWQTLSDDVGAFAKEQDIDHNPLAWRLLMAILEAMNDLYKGGMKPMPAGYFGRDDLST